MIKIFHKKNKDCHGGFTLLEMIVSLGIFAVVAVIAVGSLVKMVGLNRQAQTLQSAMNSVGYALESLSREMRVGSNFHCGTETSFSATTLKTLTAQNCPSGSSVVAFKSSRTGTDSLGNACNLAFAYWFIPDGSVYKMKKSQQVNCDSGIDQNTAYSILDEANVTLKSYSLALNKHANGHSFFSIKLVGFAGLEERPGEVSEFSVQTGVSQRIAD